MVNEGGRFWKTLSLREKILRKRFLFTLFEFLKNLYDACELLLQSILPSNACVSAYYGFVFAYISKETGCHGSILDQMYCIHRGWSYKQQALLYDWNPYEKNIDPWKSFNTCSKFAFIFNSPRSTPRLAIAWASLLLISFLQKWIYFDCMLIHSLHHTGINKRYMKFEFNWFYFYVIFSSHAHKLNYLLKMDICVLRRLLMQKKIENSLIV